MMQVVTNKVRRDEVEASLTAADKVRREIKAGRKPKMRVFPSLFYAIKLLCDEADRGRSLMQKYGLNPDDIHLALIYRPAPGMIGSTGVTRGNIGSFITKFEQMDVDFLGILWWQTAPDGRANPNSTVPMWITEFTDDKRAALDMLAFKTKLSSMPRQN